jgi:opacity protein-like surface antigen
MKKIMIASLSLSLLSGTAMFAQNTSTPSSTSQDTMSSGTVKTKTKHKKNKKGETTSTSTSK